MILGFIEHPNRIFMVNELSVLYHAITVRNLILNSISSDEIKSLSRNQHVLKLLLNHYTLQYVLLDVVISFFVYYPPRSPKYNS